MGHIKRGNCGIAQRSRKTRAAAHKHTQCRRAYGQGAIVSCIMALETAALIAFAITLHLAKR